MASTRLNSTLGEIDLRSVLMAASGTIGSVWEWAQVADVRQYGAATAKSVAPEPWEGRPSPRMATLPTGMLNGIGIQNPGIDVWVENMRQRIPALRVPVWGSAVAGDSAGFGVVAEGLETAGCAAIEVNLSCPNLEDGEMFSMRPETSHEVVLAARKTTGLPVGAKLSPNTPDVVEVARACQDAGADFVVLTNTAIGFGLSIEQRLPLLSGGPGGYSGPGLKPLSLRCVFEVAKALPELPIVGCGGVTSGRDVAEYLLSGASAVQMGTIHLAEPKAGVRIARELEKVLDRLEARTASEIIRGAHQ